MNRRDLQAAHGDAAVALTDAIVAILEPRITAAVERARRLAVETVLAELEAEKPRRSGPARHDDGVSCGGHRGRHDGQPPCICKPPKKRASKRKPAKKPRKPRKTEEPEPEGNALVGHQLAGTAEPKPRTRRRVEPAPPAPRRTGMSPDTRRILDRLAAVRQRAALMMPQPR